MAENEPDAELLAGRHRPVHADRVSSRTAATCWSATRTSAASPIRARASPATRRRASSPTAARPMPFVDKVVFDIEKEGVPLQAKFLQGYYDSPAIERLDYGTGLSGRDGDDSEEGEGVPREGHQAADDASRSTTGTSASTGSTRSSARATRPSRRERNRKLRQALSIAIDWEEHIAIFEARPGVAAHGPAAAGAVRLREDGRRRSTRSSTQAGRTASRCAARSTRRRSCWPRPAIPTAATPATGKPLVLNYDYQRAPTPGAQGASSTGWCEAVRQDRRPARGARHRLQPFQDKMRKGKHPDLLAGAGSPTTRTPRTSCSCSTVRTRKALTSGNGENNANYQNPEFDKLFEQMKLLDDGPEKQKLIDQMIEIVQKDAPWSFGYFPYVGARPTTSGSTTASRRRSIRDHIGYLRLDPELRAAQARRMEPAGLVADAADRAGRSVAGRRAGVVRAGAGASARPPRATLARRRRGDGLADDQLHHPPHRLRRADPDRRQPVHLHAVLHRQHARRHGAAEHRRQARHAGRDREVEGRARLRQAAVLERAEPRAPRSSPTRSSASARCRCSRSTSAPPTAGRDIGHEVRHAHVGQSSRWRCRCSCCGSSSASRSRCCWCSSATPTSTSGASSLCVLMLSISSLFYIIVGQFFFCKLLKLVPISGFARRLRPGRVPGAADRLSASCRGWAARRGSTARCSSRRSARTTCAPRAPRACPRRSCCSATCCATR